MPDRREDILLSELGYDHSLFASENKSQKEGVFNAMDEYMKECCLELLEYMANNNVKCGKVGVDGGSDFFYKGTWITAKQLFENFL